MSVYSVHFYDEFSDEGGPLGIAGVTRDEAVAAVSRSWAEIAAEGHNPAVGSEIGDLTWQGDIAEGTWRYTVGGRTRTFTSRYTLLRSS